MTGLLTERVTGDPASQRSWHRCRFMTCSVLPVRRACNLHCPFCFSRSSVSALNAEESGWTSSLLDQYFEFSRRRGATRLVITGGGEPLLRSERVVQLVRQGRSWFDEIACFTNGAYLTEDLAARLQDAGLSYLCYSRHHDDDERCRELMGIGAPSLEEFCRAARGLRIRATCVMTRGWIDSAESVDRYTARLLEFGVREFTFKHTYVSYRSSLFQDSPANLWSAEHQCEFDPFVGRGQILFQLPWGPAVRRLGEVQVCYYYEPVPKWELENKLCRSVNLLSDGSVYASLEDQSSLLCRLSS